MTRHIIQKYRKNPKDKSAIPTFKETIDFVLDELKKMEAGVTNIITEGFITPYST